MRKVRRAALAVALALGGTLIRAPALCAEDPEAAPAPAAGPRFALSLEATGIHEQYKETLLRGIAAGGLLPGARLCFGAEFGNLSLALRAGGSAGMTLALDKVPAEAYGIDFGLDALWNFGRPRAGSASAGDVPWFCPALAAGLSAGWAGNVHYYERLQGMHIFWFTRYGLSAVASARWGEERGWRARLEGRALLVSVTSRPPDRFTVLDTTGDDFGVIWAKMHEAPFVASPADSGDLALRLEIVSPNRAGFEGFAAYGGRVAWCALPRPCSLVQNSVSLGVRFRWGIAPARKADGGIDK